MFTISTPTSHKRRRQYFISSLETNHPSADIYLLMNHKRAQSTKSKSEKNVFLGSVFSNSAGSLPGPASALFPHPQQPPQGGMLLAPTLLCRSPFHWPPSFCCPGVLCRSGSNPANLHGDEASSAGWVLRGLGRNMPCPLERSTEGSPARED